ncbi:uncharacterized protein DEA37_0003102 [Paragonimus westermani]|uniref:Cadherin domain-containing protein n=1 Tax=Paragonimus westermani TaxID=34504 RepID=A0A5J4NA51_9TREM|nr:uncharacterized protein DEA37_0003102 [Paragonimus westermani]
MLLDKFVHIYDEFNCACLIQIVATDRDTGPAGEVTCFLESTVTSSQRPTSSLRGLLDPESREFPSSVPEFSLQPVSPPYDITGSQSDTYHSFTSQSTVRRREANYVLLTKSLLDREQRELHFLALVCHDHGDDANGNEESKSGFHLVNSNRRMTSTGVMRVLVLDENDNGPKFQLLNQNVEIRENSVPGTRIVQLSARDNDAVGSASLTHYRMANSDELPEKNRSQLQVEGLKELFSIDESNGWLLTGSTTLDRETRDTYIIPVVAYDHEFTNRTSETYIHVQVTDTNDNAPKLVGKSTFYIEEESGGAFSVGGYKSSRPGSRQIFVGHLTAEDLDLKENAQVSFSLNPTHNVTSNSDGGLSWFIRSDGTLFANLSSKGILDREKQDVYFVSIILRDHSIEQPLSSTATITVSLRDKNDNAPQFVQPPVLVQHHEGKSNLSNIVDSAKLNAVKPHVDTLRLAESTSPGTIVYTVLATDPDEGENGQVVYKLHPYVGFWQLVHFKSDRTTTHPTDTVSNQHFVIDSSSGDIRLNQRVSSLDVSSPKRLIIFAEDRGIPTRRSYAFLNIEVYSDAKNLSMTRSSGKITESIDSIPVLGQIKSQVNYKKNGRAINPVEEGSFVALSSTFELPAPNRKLSVNHLDGMYKTVSQGNSKNWNSELITGLGIGLVVIILICLFLLVTYTVHGTRRLQTVSTSSADHSKRKPYRQEQTPESIPLDESRFSNECKLSHEVVKTNPSPSMYTTLTDTFHFDTYPVKTKMGLQANANYIPITSFSAEKTAVSPVPSPHASCIKVTCVANREPDANFEVYDPVDELNFSERSLTKDTEEQRAISFFPETVHIPQLLESDFKAELSVTTSLTSATGEDVLIKIPKQKLGNQSSFV